MSDKIIKNYILFKRGMFNSQYMVLDSVNKEVSTYLKKRGLNVADSATTVKKSRYDVLSIKVSNKYVADVLRILDESSSVVPDEAFEDYAKYCKYLCEENK